MRILYGVVGEGMGHATRSRVIIEHLIEREHDVEIIVSGRAHAMLHDVFPDRVRRIHGLGIVYEHNEVKKRKTLIANARDLFARGGLPANVKSWFDLVTEFEPELVISDFESWSWLFAVNHRIPLISIDNMQIINRCDIKGVDDGAMLAGHRGQFRVARAIVKAKIPGALHYFVSTFYYPPVRKKRTTLVPPILRPEVLKAKATAERGEHVVVYQTGPSHEALIDALRRLRDVDFLIYGMKAIAVDSSDGSGEGSNLHFRPFSQQGFIDDLASCRAVVAGGGFSLMSECVYLGKPMLSVPLKGQFEQTLNALWLERLGYGLYRNAADAIGITELLSRDTEFAANLAGHQQDGNVELLAQLDALLNTVETGGGRSWVGNGDSESDGDGDGDGEGDGASDSDSDSDSDGA
jgi:uncharacterized protein (TIGR00661 family)